MNDAMSLSDYEWQETEIYPRVPASWVKKNLGALGTFKNGLNFNSAAFGKGIPIINVTHLHRGKYASIDSLDELKNEAVKKVGEYSLKAGDILFARSSVKLEGTGQVAMVKNLPSAKTCFSGFIIRLRIEGERVNAEFLNYLLRSNQYRDFFVSIATGTSIFNLTQEILSSVLVYLPRISEQRAIAAVLKSLDDKIDLLHRQNQTLEAMAATLFRQWFVEEAREGWEERPLSRIANFLNGLACQKHPPKSELEKLPVLKIKELSGGVSESSDWASSEIKPEYIVEAGDVIFAWSASLMVKVWDGERCVLNQHLFKVTSTEFPKWFYLMWCKHHLAEFISISSSHATTMGHIKRGDLDAAIVSVPPEKELKAMSEQMAPLLDKQISISKQIRILEKLRDTLLPKLMSGEVRVAA
ncbi:MAG: restriction endonuclease subunit S [Pseudohongiella sp.]|nr:restriction endonuclease subunit S [Pseudohongiella sp.]